MNVISRLNISSKNYTATQIFASDQNRGYFAVHTAAASVTIGLKGGDPFTLPANSVWEPRICPTSVITVTGTGPYVVLSTHQE